MIVNKLIREMSEEDLDELLRKMVDALEKFIPGDAGVVLLMGSQETFMRSSHNLKGKYLPDTLRKIARYVEEEGDSDVPFPFHYRDGKEQRNGRT